MPFQKGHKINIGNKYSLGRPPWNTGKELPLAMREKIRQSKLGKKPSLKTKIKMSLSQKGHHRGGWEHSEATKQKIRLSTTGEKNWHWIKDRTIYQENKRIRMSLEYKDWRIKVFRRDDYTCQECGSRGVSLHADHIKPFAYYPELRLVIENGRTLCIPCHKKTETYAGKMKNYKKISIKN